MRRLKRGKKKVDSSVYEMVSDMDRSVLGGHIRRKKLGYASLLHSTPVPAYP